MKNIAILLMGCLMSGAHMRAQTNDCVVPMMILVPEQAEALPNTAQSMLEGRLRQMLLQYGMEGGAGFSNFSIVAHTFESSKELLSGTRPLVTLTIELQLFVGNNYTGEKFASSTLRLTGAGRNEAKAYIAAFSGIRSDNAQLQAFLNDVRRKVNEYYATQVPAILQRAKSYAVRHNFEEALCLLASVPTCCNRYDEVEQYMTVVFQDYINFDCADKVSKARAVWNATQDKEGALLAGAYLTAIDPSSSCWEEALALAETIRQRIGDDWEFSKELQREVVGLEMSRIRAMRDIGVAFGENQKAKTVHENWIVR
ncbi:MAG: hypothetical protein NC388_01375 [Clostridium sp.]|nr:hypothetical protein [Clostridium sp.]